MKAPFAPPHPQVLSCPEDPAPVQLLSGLAAHGLLLGDEALALGTVAARAMRGQARMTKQVSVSPKSTFEWKQMLAFES